MSWKRKVKGPATIGECTIVECKESRCDEYLVGKCERCLDFCARYNWLGWQKVEETGIDINLWENGIENLYRLYSEDKENGWVFVKYSGRYYAFETQALILSIFFGRRCYELDCGTVFGFGIEDLERIIKLAYGKIIFKEFAKDKL